MLVRNLTTTGLSTAEILLFIKKDGRKVPSPTLRNFWINKHKMVIIRED